MQGPEWCTTRPTSTPCIYTTFMIFEAPLARLCLAHNEHMYRGSIDCTQKKTPHTLNNRRWKGCIAVGRHPSFTGALIAELGCYSMKLNSWRELKHHAMTSLRCPSAPRRGCPGHHPWIYSFSHPKPDSIRGCESQARRQHSIDTTSRDTEAILKEAIGIRGRYQSNYVV